ncbi:MAG: hypothetical protein LBF05_00070, partial [Tannerella sp.]|nr:hypothetical protein [Tannerella sp.]
DKRASSDNVGRLPKDNSAPTDNVGRLPKDKSATADNVGRLPKDKSIPTDNVGPPHHILLRHCKEHSDVAIQVHTARRIALPCGLPMTR